jgi:hypothetical protein
MEAGWRGKVTKGLMAARTKPPVAAERLTATHVISVMSGMVPDQVPRMRALAQRLRGQAAETGIALYRRKMESLASELEEAATEAESRQRFFERVKLVS